MLLAAALPLLTAGCGSRATMPEFKPQRPADDVIVADTTVRYEGPGLTLRADSAGVLVKVSRDGSSAAFYDIDGNARAELRGAALSVNGAPVQADSVLPEVEGATYRAVRIIDSQRQLHTLIIPKNK